MSYWDYIYITNHEYSARPTINECRDEHSADATDYDVISDDECISNANSTTTAKQTAEEVEEESDNHAPPTNELGTDKIEKSTINIDDMRGTDNPPTHQNMLQKESNREYQCCGILRENGENFGDQGESLEGVKVNKDRVNNENQLENNNTQNADAVALECELNVESRTTVQLSEEVGKNNGKDVTSNECSRKNGEAFQPPKKTVPHVDRSKLPSVAPTTSYGGTRCKSAVNIGNKEIGTTEQAQECTENIKTINKGDIIDENDINFTFTTHDINELVDGIIEKLNKQVFNGNKSKNVKNIKYTATISGTKQKPSDAMPHNNEEFTERPSLSITDPGIKTLGDALRHFKLYERLHMIEISLEDVRRRKKGGEEHMSEFKQFDKEIQKLSIKYHPDRVKNRGGSEEQVEIAHKLQIALNATRTVLSVLNEIFLKDIDTDHRFGFFTKLNITSLANEDEIRSHVSKIFLKISFISEIKRKIITEIYKFLIESKGCIQYFFAKQVTEFGECRNSALFHLKRCVKEYKKLIAEYTSTEEECANENLDHMILLLRKISSDCSRNLDMLRAVKKVAKKSLGGACHIYSTLENIDDYFVLPFVTYINVINMCNAMLKTRKRNLFPALLPGASEPAYNHQTSFMNYLYYISSYYSGNIDYEHIIERTMGERRWVDKEIKTEFAEGLAQLNEYLEEKFKVDDYYVGITRKNYLEDYEKCMKLMADFKRKESQLINSYEKFEKRSEEIEKRFKKAMEESEKITKKTKVRLQ